MELNNTYIKIFIILFVTLGLVLPINIYIKNSSQTLSEKIEKTITKISNEEWDNSKKEYSDFKNTWSNSKNLWAIFIDHSEIDRIEDSVIRLEKYIYTSNKGDALPESSVLLKNISHIYEKKQFSIKNIL